MESKKAGAMATATALLGLGLGNVTSSPEPLPAPEPITLPAPQPERIEVRFEELRHTGDKSLRDAWNMPGATNADFVVMVENKDKAIAQKDSQIDKLRGLNKQAAAAIKSSSENLERAQAEIAALKSTISAADQYRRGKSEGKR